MVYKLFNAGLRLTSLAIKMMLMLYMAKYLGLYDLGTFGLVSAIVALSIPLFGMQLEYVTSRDIINQNDQTVSILIKEEVLFYLLNYLILIILCICALTFFEWPLGQHIIFYTVTLCILEGLSTVATANLTSLQRPIMGNVVFFIRSSLWAIPVMIFGFFDETYRQIDIIFQLWIAGVFLSLLFTIFVMRNLPWTDAFATAVNWQRVRDNIRKSLPFWGGALCLAGAVYVDRFLIEFFLDREFVGIISFYSSFVVAIAALTGSGVYSFSYPKMITFFKEKQFEELTNLTKQSAIHAAVWSVGLSLIIAIIIPLLGLFIHRPEIHDHRYVLYVMLVAVCIRTISKSLEFLLYARNQDSVIWTSNLIFLISALFFGMTFLPAFGFIGIGYSALASAFMMALWQSYHSYHYKT